MSDYQDLFNHMQEQHDLTLLESEMSEIATLCMRGFEVMICTGCGHLLHDPIYPPHLSCCPDARHIPIKEFFEKSKLK